jgi:hypothetical protein
MSIYTFRSNILSELIIVCSSSVVHAENIIVSGTIIRGTPKTPNLSWQPPSAQSCKGLMGAIKSRLGPLKGHDLASPELSLEEGRPTPEDSRLARGPLKKRTHLRLV